MNYLQSVIQFWIKEKELCRKSRQKQFGDTADVLWGFMGKSFTDLYIEASGAFEEFHFSQDLLDADGETAGPYYKPRLNKTREFVNVVLPFVHAKIPDRVVSSRRPPLPEMLAAALGVPDGPTPDEKLRAWLLQWWLNYLPGEYGAKREQRTAIIEALAKGRGVAWHEMIAGPMGFIPGSFYDTVDHLFIDHSCRQWREAGYLLREHHWPSWRLAERFGIDARKLEGAQKQAAQSGRAVPREGSDECVWFEVWSRVGVGQHHKAAGEELHEKARMLDSLGRHIWLAILPGLDYPLNLPPHIWDVATEAELHGRMEWPIAFFAEPSNPFPCTPLDIYPGTDSPWPTAPLAGVIPLQVFLDHLYAFLMGRVRSTCRDIIITADSLERAVKQAIVSGRDQTVVGMKDFPGEEIQKLVHILQFPPLNADAWRIVLQVERAFEQGSGMDPLLYGGEGNRQIRSAEEAGVRQANVTNRPNDYADAVEEWNSQCASKEGQMSRLYVQPQTVAPLFGEQVTEDENAYGPLTMTWAALVNTDDPAEACADLVLVEAGSGRRKNRQKQTSDLQAISQTLLPMLQQFALQGLVGPWNEYVDMAAEVFELPLGRLKLPELMPPQEQGDPQAEEQARREEETRGDDNAYRQQELAIKAYEAETKRKQAMKPRPQ